jgi:predicted metal-dependent hydrolase
MIQIDEIIRSKRRSIALIVQPDGKLIVRAPTRMTDREIYALVNKKAPWIQKQQTIVKSVPPPAVRKKYIDGEKFWYLGQAYPLEIVDGNRPAIELKGCFLINRAVLPKASLYFTRWYKEQALREITPRVDWYAAKMGLVYRQIKITSAQRRWGSCSSKGTLCFTWRLVMAPLPVIDYVVIHELAHLQEKNHSKAFWAVVGAIMPAYKEKRKWLKMNSHQMMI